MFDVWNKGEMRGYKVYDVFVKPNSTATYFLVYDAVAGCWRYVPANDFEPIEDEEVL